MNTRILSAAAAGALLLGLAVQPAGAQINLHRDLLTFSGPVALPGVVLVAGTYSFEVPDNMFSPSLVRVRSKDGRQVYLTQYARIVERPNSPKVPPVTFGEAAPGSARPIQAWFPIGGDSGRQFVYN
jgi:hypothetical protein